MERLEKQKWDKYDRQCGVRPLERIGERGKMKKLEERKGNK